MKRGKNMKKTKRMLAIVFAAILMALSVFSVIGLAAEKPVIHPSTETPMTFSYNVKVTAYDKYGRALEMEGDNSYHDNVTSGTHYGYVVDFYPNEAAYKAKQDPMASIGFNTDKKGQGTATYSEVFVKDPPATLYFHVRPEVDTFFSPASGTVAVQ